MQSTALEIEAALAPSSHVEAAAPASSLDIEAAAAPAASAEAALEIFTDAAALLTEKQAELAALHKAHTKAGGGKGSGRWKHAEHQRKKELEQQISRLETQAASLPPSASHTNSACPNPRT